MKQITELYLLKQECVLVDAFLIFNFFQRTLTAVEGTAPLLMIYTPQTQLMS